MTFTATSQEVRARTREVVSWETQVPDDIVGETMDFDVLTAWLQRLRAWLSGTPLPKYAQPGQPSERWSVDPESFEIVHHPGPKRGWTLRLDPKTGWISPVRRPGYTGPLPKPFKAADQVWN